MLKAQEKFNKTLRDSVQSFLKEYNKDMHFDMIISKQGDNVLYANEKLDITREVVNGMINATKVMIVRAIILYSIISPL